MNLEANRATQSVVRKVISNEQEITDISKINNHILQFYQNLFKEKQSTSENRFNSLLNDLNIPSLNSEEMLSCEGNLTEQEIYKSLTILKIISHLVMMGLQKNSVAAFGMILKIFL